jgi:cobalt-zinc-cadmium efflux system protein
MSHSHHHVEEATADLRLAFFLNLGSALLELFGGLWTNSVAILSNAVHDLGDSLSLGVAWYLDRYATRDGDARFSYGYRRFTLLGAWANTVVLLIGSAFVLSEAIPRLFAVVGIAVNGLAAMRLCGKRSMNARVAAWHLVEDILGWVAVLIVATTLLFVDLPILDPLLSVGISVYNVERNVRQILMLFLQAVPEDVDLAVLERRFRSLDDVLSAHHTHVWSMDGARHVLTTHLVVAEA